MSDRQTGEKETRTKKEVIDREINNVINVFYVT